MKDCPKRLPIFFMFAFLSISLLGQAQEMKGTEDTYRANAINVFMDADSHIKREITFVNYVRDQKDAQVNIIRTVQPTGAGGIEYTFFFEGLKEFKGVNDTLKVVSQPNESTENVRSSIIRALKTGLIRYVSKTPLIQYFNIAYLEPESIVEPDDSWNNWVFNIGLNGYLDGQKSYSSIFYSGNVSANRITEERKTEFSLNYHKSRDRFTYEDDEIIGKNQSYGANLLHVISMGNHFSAGASGNFRSSSYSNLNSRFGISPAIEYNFFPYSQSTRRQLRLQYLIGYEYNNYIDTTIYNKTRESLFSHSISVAFALVEKWGSVSVNTSYRNYLHDFSKKNLSVNGGLNLRVVKGLSFRLNGGVSVIHDQLSLRKGNLTLEQMLLQRTELATQYRFYTSMGLSFSFGSIFNNVVNPRFGSSYHYY